MTTSGTDARLARNRPKAGQVRYRTDKAGIIHCTIGKASFEAEALKGNLAGFYSIRINDQWRLCFRFEAGDAFDVEIVDYH